MSDHGAEKRRRDDAPDAGRAAERERKRSRWDALEAAPPPPPAPAASAADKLSAVQAKQSALAAKLAQLKALKEARSVVAPAPAAPAPAARAARPAALLLDSLGREIDAAGNLLSRTAAPAAPTLKVNARAAKAANLGAALESARRAVAAEAALRPSPGAAGFDPRMAPRAAAAGGRRGGRGLQFVTPGSLAQAAEAARVAAGLRAALEGDPGQRRAALRALRHEEAVAKAARYEGAAAAEGEAAEAAPPPAVEWWDAPLLGKGGDGLSLAYGSYLSGVTPLAPAKVSLYVEHPVALPPVGEAPPPPPQPLRLTKAEQKKLRTQRRVAREKERQDMLRQGLLEPPKPKVRIANLMRVLGAEATADPTAVEREVKAAMAERAEAHADRNAARALTPAERREKKARKLFEEANGAAGELQCAAFRVDRLDQRLNETKLLLNAEENHLTGCAVKTADFAIVVVEGARKAIARFRKLMLRRMDWQLRPEPAAPEDPDDPECVAAALAAAEEAAAAAEAEGRNRCILVWCGAVAKPAFPRFRIELIRTVGGAAKYFEDVGARHLWDLAAAGVEVE